MDDCYQLARIISNNRDNDSFNIRQRTTMKFKKILIGILITPIILLSMLYFLLDGFLESEEIEPNSIKSWFMVPDLLKSDELEHLGHIQKYVYWPVDNSPEVTEVYILVHGSNELIKKRVLNFIAQNGFVKGRYSWMGYMRGYESLSFYLEEKGKDEWLVNISYSH